MCSVYFVPFFFSLNNAGDIYPLLCSVCVNNRVWDPGCEKRDVSKPGEETWNERKGTADVLAQLQVQLKSVLTTVCWEGRGGVRGHRLRDSRAAAKAPKCFVTDDFSQNSYALLPKAICKKQKSILSLILN